MAVLWLGLGWSLPAEAQNRYRQPGATAVDDSRFERPEKVDEPSYSFLLRAHKEAPRDQLAYTYGLLSEGRNKKALRQFRALVKKWPTSREASEAQYMAARLYQDLGKRTRAVEAFNHLLQRYTTEIPTEEILSRLYRLGQETLEERRGDFLVFGGFLSPARAIPVFRSVVTFGPAWSNAPAAQLAIGEAFLMDKKYEEAIPELETVLYRYPDAPQAEEAAFLRADALREMSLANPRSRRMAEQAQAAYTMVLQEYPDAPRREEARVHRDELRSRIMDIALQRATFYDEYVRRPELAIREYEKFLRRYPRSPASEDIQSRIQILKSDADAPENASS